MRYPSLGDRSQEKSIVVLDQIDPIHNLYRKPGIQVL